MLHLHLNGRSLLVLDLEGPLSQLPEDNHTVTFVKRVRGVLGDRSPCRAAEETVGDVLPLAAVLAAVTDRNGEVREGRATLGVTEFGIVGDISD
jgi:hypothetical protein